MSLENQSLEDFGNETATKPAGRKIKLDADGKPIMRKKIKLDENGKPIKKKKKAPTEAVNLETAIIAETVESTEILDLALENAKKPKKKDSSKKPLNKALIAGITAACLVVASVGGVFAYNALSGKHQPEEVVEETLPPETEPATTASPVETEVAVKEPEKEVVLVPTFTDCSVKGESIEKDLTLYVKNVDNKKVTGAQFKVLLVEAKNKSKVEEKLKDIKDLNAKIKELEEAAKKATPSASPLPTSAKPSTKETQAADSADGTSSDASSDKYASTEDKVYISSITGEELTELEKLFIQKREIYEQYAAALEEVGGTIYTDEDGDGVIYIKSIKSGDYVACFIPTNHEGDSFVPASYMNKVKVKEKLEFKAVEEIKDKTVSEKEAGDEKIDHGDSVALTDTVKYYANPAQDPSTVVATKATVAALKVGAAASQGINVVTTKKPAECTCSTSETKCASNEAGKCDVCKADHTKCKGKEPETPAPTEPASTETPSSSSSDSNESPETPPEGSDPALTQTMMVPARVHTAETKNVVLTVSATKIYQTSDAALSTATISLTKPDGLTAKILLDGKEITDLTLKANELSAVTHKVSATIVDANGETQTVPEIPVAVESKTTQLVDDKGTLLYLDDKKTKATVENYKPDLVVYTITETPGAKHGWWEESDGWCYYGEDGKRVTGEQVIGGAKYTFNQNGIRTSNGICIDVSKWQGNIDWKKASSSVSYAIIRCGIRGKTGELAIDSYVGTNMQNAKKNGVKVGLYFYSRAQNEVQAVEEASLAVSIANQYGGCSLPIYIDMEDATQSGLTTAQRDAIVMAFCNTVKNSGYAAGVYANKNWLTTKLTPKNYSGISIWVAQYADKCTYNGSYKMWQYTSKGSIPGISGNVDMNIMY